MAVEPRVLSTALARKRLPRRRRIGSAGRLAAFHALVLAIVLGAVVLALVRNFSTSYQSAAASDIAVQLRQFAASAASRPPAVDLHSFAIQFLREHPIAPGDAVVVALGNKGLVVTGNAARLVHDPIVAGWFKTPPQGTLTLSKSLGGTPFEIVAAPIRVGATTVGTYIAAKDLHGFAAEGARVLRLSLAEAGVALLVAVASAFALLRRLLATVGRITNTAERIGSGALEERLLDEGRSDEVGELVRTFDTMLDRLEAAMLAQRRLLADVSHQLRTPLTVVRGHLEVLSRTGTDEQSLRETLELVIDELDHMAILIERLLMLGRAMEPDLLAPSEIDLPEFLTGIVDSVAVLAPRRYLLVPTPALRVRADREQLRGAIVNLLENAVHATSEGDLIALGAEHDEQAQALRVIVEDSGPGIPAAQREAVLERFARPGARDADGSGLGLAIVKAVALAHGGAVAVEQSPTLGGARVVIVLPDQLLLEAA